MRIKQDSASSMLEIDAETTMDSRRLSAGRWVGVHAEPGVRMLRIRVITSSASTHDFKLDLEGAKRSNGLTYIADTGYNAMSRSYRIIVD